MRCSFDFHCYIEILAVKCNFTPALSLIQLTLSLCKIQKVGKGLIRGVGNYES